MYVACSTLCFGKVPLTDALRSIGEMGFTKVDVAFRESGPHLKPSEVAADPSRAAQMLRARPGVVPAAFHAEFADGLAGDELERQMRALCRLARVMAVPVVSVPAAECGADVDTEVMRLSALVKIAESEGVGCTVETRTGTLTETPAGAADLCRRVPGLGITLDPSHYVARSQPNEEYDELFPFVRHVRLRDSGPAPDKFQVRVGQGRIEYGKIVNQLTRCRYDRTLSVDIRDDPEPPYPMQPEVRKLKYLLESLI